jgi:tetratricopeptide (TPR) repeat protein
VKVPAGFLLFAFLAASAGAAPGVDRERLRQAPQLPSVGPRGWYYGMTCDGRLFEGGENPLEADASELRARIGDDETDPRPWIDLAAACRRAKDAEGTKGALSKALTIAARARADHPDDGQALAEEGLVLAAAGDDAGADKCVADAAGRARGAWAAAAARGDLVVVRAIAKAAGCRFASLDDAYSWPIDEQASARVDAKSLAAAAAAYDEAVSLAQRASLTGLAASSVHLRRSRLLGLLDACAPDDEPEEEGARRRARAGADHRRSLEFQADEPDAVTMLALDDAMGDPDPESGNRSVRSYEQLTDAAREKIVVHVRKLGAIATGTDLARAARALQGGAALHWFVRHDATATEAALRLSVAKDPKVRQSWNALVLVLADAQRWDDLAKVCAAWVDAEDGAPQRMMLAKSLWTAGDAEGAEKHWRAALALEPKSPAANVGVAVLVLRRAKTDADVAEARKLVRAASDALAPDAGKTDPGLAAACGLADAVALGLAGDLDASEKSAHRLLDDYGEFPQAREVLAAIGR